MAEKHAQRAKLSCIGVVRMRRLVFCIIALAALSGYALAHPPSDVTVSYNENTGDLTVTISHQVDNPATHYVKHVTVLQGSKVLIDQTYTSQPDKTAFTYTYNIPQLKGTSEEITAVAECSIAGSRSGTLYLTGTTVPGTPVSTGRDPTQAPGCWVVVFLALGLAILPVRR
jgi:hypothetical protein